MSPICFPSSISLLLLAYQKAWALHALTIAHGSQFPQHFRKVFYWIIYGELLKSYDWTKKWEQQYQQPMESGKEREDRNVAIYIKCTNNKPAIVMSEILYFMCKYGEGEGENVERKRGVWKSNWRFVWIVLSSELWNYDKLNNGSIWWTENKSDKWILHCK